MVAFKSDFSSPLLGDLQQCIHRHVRYSIGKEWKDLTNHDIFIAVAMAARDFIVDHMIETEERYRSAGAKRLYYFSMEFLMGRSLGNNLINMGLYNLCKESLIQHGFDLEEIREAETDAALGNGGLGRLAACFLDSLATLGMPGFGYGINYEYGLFKQVIDNGFQREKPDNWLASGTPWEIEHGEEACLVPVYGRIEHARDRRGDYNPMWMDWKLIIGVPHDMPIVGYGGRTVNYLRLYSARASDEFDMQIFNNGDYLKAMSQKVESETITKVLYPSDSIQSGKELRLLQEYFLVACSIRDIFRRYLSNHTGFGDFSDRVAIQLNDTHPALTVAELMRMFVDDYGIDWDEAWEITHATLGYTNHTLMSEALERWPASLMAYIIPRHLQVIYEINRRFIQKAQAIWPGDNEHIRSISIIEEGDQPQVRMAHLAMIGSHSVNGVSALHSELIKKVLAPDLNTLWPEKFNNKTNGVTQRRWLLEANPGLSNLIMETIGDGWITNLDALQELESSACDPSFQNKFLHVKTENKQRLAALIQTATGRPVDTTSLFDVQIKRMHEYKRQLLKVMHIIHQYLCITEDGVIPLQPRTYIFAGKAAPGYWAAKQIIKLINSVAHVVNNDPKSRDTMRVAFLPDYRVSLAERIIPAADLSEQISTAGMEASGTGNMKLAMNGALTMGTLDGANIEILEAVHPENIFIFGLKAEEIQKMRSSGSYSPWERYSSDAALKRVVDTFDSPLFCSQEEGLFRWIYEALLHHEDPYFHLADFASYVAVQEQADLQYRDRSGWANKAILNVARIGKFSSDRTIMEYARDVWNIKSIV